MNHRDTPIEEMTPSEVMLHREIGILKSKLAFFEKGRPFPNYLSEDPPVIIPVEDISQTMILAIEARGDEDNEGGSLLGYHVMAKDHRTGYRVGYYVSDMELNQNRYRVAEFMNKMLRDVTMCLARDIERGRA